MTITNITENEKIFMEDFIIILETIKEFEEANKPFVLTDLITEEQMKDMYFRYRVKGILQTLIYLEYIEIITMIGNKNFIYKIKNKIKK